MVENFEVVYFQLVGNDLQRGMDFYRSLFGWKIEPMAGMEKAYSEITIKEAGLNGGLSSEGKPGTLIFISVPSVSEWIEKAIKLGATVAMPRTAIPNDMGFMAIIGTPDGNSIGLWSKE